MKMSNKVYDVLKWVVMIVLPGLAALYTGLAETWNLPFAVQIPTTIMLVDTFLGSSLMISTAKYNKSESNDN